MNTSYAIAWHGIGVAHLIGWGVGYNWGAYAMHIW